MSWGEAIRLTGVLLADPSAQITAAIYGWHYPVSREWMVNADVWDAMSHQVYKDPKPYPRPFPDPSSARRGRTTKARAEVVAILNAHGHEIGG